ncbi:unnamed protein product, partial [Discosporangium mesarthrocarpum]
GATFAVGDKVEARYKGKIKSYKGKISRVNSDHTFDVDYDDGEKERGLAEKHLKLLGTVDDGRLGNNGTGEYMEGGKGRSRHPPEHDERGSRGGARLCEGDKIEARYRGKGEYYKGKISRVNSDDTFDIDYDDGEKERGLAEEHIKPLESGRSDRLPRGAGGKLREGDKVEARYRGRGKYYTGRISRVNSDGTFDINYDDGENERGLAEEHIKPRESASAGRSPRINDQKLREGDKVEARYKGRGKYYKGNITRVNSDGTFDIHYDDGERERGLAEEYIKSLESGSSGQLLQNNVGKLREGDKVEARYKGRGKYYKGKISRVNSDGTFDINYDDGERKRGLAEYHIKLDKLASAGRSLNSDGRNLREGDKVEARYKGRGKYYKGKIARVNSDGTFDIDYDDGERERGLAEYHIKSHESGDGEGSPHSIGEVREGDKVEARYRGSGKYYKGKIAKVNTDGTFDIDYDDGEKERGLAEQHVKPLESGEDRRSPRRSGG